MAITNPPITAMARGCCICAPRPTPSASGVSARMAEMAVINLGRIRVEIAKLIACSALWVFFNSHKLLNGKNGILGNNTNNHDDTGVTTHIQRRSGEVQSP